MTEEQHADNGYYCNVRMWDEPEGYVNWHIWAEKKGKTHIQKQCPRCGLWHIWEPRYTQTETIESESE